jgi:chromatin assembly factor 1 subunit A
VQILDILPQEAMAQIKKSRVARKKVGTQFNTLAKLLASLNEADKLIYDHETATAKSKSAIKVKLDKVLARISQEEEKTLKYEREAEKMRLSNQAKDMKQNQAKAAKEKKEREEQEKQKLKEQMAHEKERKKEESAREKEMKKQEATQKKEAAVEAKRQKQEQIDKAEAQKKAQLSKQRKCMQSFFTTAKPASAKKAAEAAPDATAAAPAVVGESNRSSATPVKVVNDSRATTTTDSSSPITCITEAGHATPYTAINSSARRKRKTKLVTVSVYVTPDLGDGAWGQQAFAELQPVKVRNGFKFLRFYEDIRPAYHGTWSKKSSIVTGRTPFAKDTKFLNYEYDSEAEWEEGDDEVGEDIENDAGDDDEEKDDEEVDEEDDGWLAADDEFGDDPDEETIRLRKKLRSMGGMSRPRNGENIVCIIAPSMGKPIDKMDGTSECDAALVEGLAFHEGVELLYVHYAETVNDYSLYLDAFPPPFCEETEDGVDASASPSDGNKQASSAKEMSLQDQQTFIRFVHNSSWVSKDKLVDEFRTSHPTITSSRALVVRTLEDAAVKKKHPIKVAVWEVKREILEKLELRDLADQAAIDDPEEAQKHILKEIAMSVHHTTFSSKEKLADALLATQFSFSISRAELMRHLEAMAEKKKVAAGSSVFWEVKASVIDELGLADQLSSSPPPALAASASDSAAKPPSEEDEARAANASAGAASKEEKTTSKKSSVSTGKKRKAVDKSSSAGSSKLLASFLTKKT